ncbi:site-specific integrase [Roseateles albus]|uniref:Tyr recombinase domain-containing protein n=1 Tax=Roseateles albus TaxID=2987525 RepID=A0ABT5KCY8_9BURK|nr:hypothetical protein [Roseateles albus]MDC8771785.1 hypothetical protein [Roseateles albus]
MTEKTEKKEPKRPAMQFESRASAATLPAPPKGAYFEYPHIEYPQFKVRVHPADADGRIKRQYTVRIKHQGIGKDGRVGPQEDRSVLGLAVAVEKGEVELPFVDALTEYLNRHKKLKALKASPAAMQEAKTNAKRMTVGDAWARHETETRTQRTKTTDKETSVYRTYLAHLSDAYLDELEYKFWSAFVAQVGKGKLLHADGKQTTALAGKRAEATVIGVINFAAKLYTFAHRLEGLGGRPSGWNPAGEARRTQTGTPNKRTGHIPLVKLAEAWRAADVLCASWARDQFYLYVLTGLRHSLLATLQFSEVDQKYKVLRISPHKPGTKRRGVKTPADAPDLIIPICDDALKIIAARRPFAPDKNGPVWYATTAPGGKPAAKGVPKIPVNSDPRSNWAHIQERVLDGVAFMRHDLRRTFARLGSAAGADLTGLSLLLMHSPKTLGTTLRVPDVTIDYTGTAEARGHMRAATKSIEKYMRGLLDGSVIPPLAEDLPDFLEAALSEDEDE